MDQAEAKTVSEPTEREPLNADLAASTIAAMRRSKASPDRKLELVVEGMLDLAGQISALAARVSAAPSASPGEVVKSSLLASSELALADARGRLGTIVKQDEATATAVSALEAALGLLQTELRRISQKQWDHIVERENGVIVAMRSIPVYPT